MKKIVVRIALVMCVLILGMYIGGEVSNKQGEDEYNEVMEVMASSRSGSEKAIYLYKRRGEELSIWRVLKSHADLCSNKYLNELASLELRWKQQSKGMKS